MLPGWLNENSYRDYPFQPGADIAKDAIADMGVLLGPFMDQQSFSNSAQGSNYDCTTDDFYLYSIKYTAPYITLTFKLTASAFSATSLVFVIDPALPFKTYYGNAYQGSKLMCQGFITTGYLTDFFNAVSDGQTHLPTNTKLERACIQDLSSRFVSSLNLANFPRLKIDAPIGCPGNGSNDEVAVGSIYFPDQSISLHADNVSINGGLYTQAIVAAQNIEGDVKFREGYNCALRQEGGTNSLVISAALGAGAGLACDQVPIDKYEESLLRSLNGAYTLTGGPTCNSVLKSVNGVSGENILISVGKGFRIQPSTTDTHTLIISASAEDFAACLN